MRPQPVRPTMGGGVAAACLTVLSVWQWQDGRHGWALALLTLAGLQLAALARRTAATPRPDRAAEVEHARRHRPAWRVIGIGGVVGALATAQAVPPLALVLAALGSYAALRARSSGRVPLATT